MPKKPCAWHRSGHHSNDIIEVWYGRSEPTYLCGYHESRSHGVYSEVEALGEPAALRVAHLADEADAAFRSEDIERYEDLQEQIQDLIDNYPSRGFAGAGPSIT